MERVRVRRWSIAWLWWGVIASGCASEVGSDPDVVRMGAAAEGTAGSAAQAPSFDEVYGLLEASCGGGRSGCHVTGTAANLAMPDADAAYDALVGVASARCEGHELVTPFDPDASVLVQALEGSAECVKPMPLGRDPLGAEPIATVRDWIAAGAERD